MTMNTTRRNTSKKTIQSVDDEWDNFISSNYNIESTSEEGEGEYDDDDDNIVGEERSKNDLENNNEHLLFSENIGAEEYPISSELRISTKSKVAFLNQCIDIDKIFWGIQIIPYSKNMDGVIKKQMKFDSLNQECLDGIIKRLEPESFVHQHIITHIDNPTGRIKFKDVRKISVGICKKDIINGSIKKENAFRYCFVMIIRLKHEGCFKEFHVKVFNTGKIEIPGIQSEDVFEIVLKHIVVIIQPIIDTTHENDEKPYYLPLSYLQNSKTILVNSNFNCGYYINREALFSILKFKYNIQCIYDPCSNYPGIQCKFFYNTDLKEQTGSQILLENIAIHTNIVEVSFMIFRTGNILIVGMCEDNVLNYIYEFLKHILHTEYPKINQKVIGEGGLVVEQVSLLQDGCMLVKECKKKKVRRKTIFMSV